MSQFLSDFLFYYFSLSDTLIIGNIKGNEIEIPKESETTGHENTSKPGTYTIPQHIHLALGDT